MKKLIYVLNALELLKKLCEGKRVEGVLYMDENTGKLTFKAYNRQRKHAKDFLVKKLPWGWVKESAERIKVYESIPKDLGAAKVMTIIDQELKEAKDAIIERELDLIEFC
jgi:hypothetical protein